MQKYRPDIDGLRALAVLPVVFFHAHIPGFSGGYVGVDVFFVISGYLITSIIYTEAAAGRFSILKFYERRIRRILPALFSVIVFCLAVASILFMPDEMKAFGKSIVATIFFSSNFLFWRDADYFDKAAETKPLLHTWSLAVEEQFYIVFPLVLLFCVKYLPRKVSWAIAAAAIGSFFFSVIGQRHFPDANFYLPFSRAWELLLGSLLALNVLPNLRSEKARDAVALFGLAALGLSIFLYDNATPFPGIAAVPPVLGTAFVIYAGMADSSRVKALLGRRELVFIGLISYSLYLWHWPLLVFARMIAVDDLSLIQAGGVVLLSFALSVLSWHYIERPFRERTALASRPALFSTTFAAMAGFLFLGGVLVVTSGLPQRFSDRIREVANTAHEAEDFSRQYKCSAYRFVASQIFGPCYIGEKNKPTVAVWGDSEAMALKPMFDSLFKEQKISGVLASMPGCPPIFELDRVNYGVPCLALSNKFLELLRSGGIKKVVIVGNWEGVFSSKNTVLHGQISFDDATRYENVRLGLHLTLKRLEENGIQVAFFMPMPGARKEVPQSLARSMILGRKADIEYSRAEFAKRQKPIEDILSSVSPFPAVIVTTSDYLCTETCDVVRDGQPLYFDASHPSHYLNRLLEPFVRKQLATFLNGVAH